MKYLWIIIIAIPYIIWSITSIIDIINTFIECIEDGILDVFFSLDFYTQVWLELIIFALFIYSISLYVAT